MVKTLRTTVSQLLVLAAVATGLLISVSSAQACHRRYYSGYSSYGYEHPYIQKALIGGGIGAVAGGALGYRGDRIGNAFRGALIGSAAGTGYEYLRQRRVFSGDRDYHRGYPGRGYGYGRNRNDYDD